MTHVFSRSVEGLRIHFIAIGGIGMSALARLAVAEGAIVSGCDSTDSPTLAALRKLGCTTHIGHSADHVHDCDLVIHSSAIKSDNKEMIAASLHKIPIIHRGRLLAMFQEGRDTVAISGAHGKTTTTWIIANMMIKCGQDPLVAIGGNVPDMGGNARPGKGKIFVTEADESDGSFLELSPKYPVITNIDADHLDYYTGGIEHIKKCFTEFAETRTNGCVIACAECENVREILPLVRGRRITYGIEHGDIRALNIRQNAAGASFDVKLPDGNIESNISISLPGKHNILNSLSAIAIAFDMKLPMDKVREALANTSTVGRRLEKRGEVGGITVYDDYAHHPAEIAAMLDSARRIAQGRLIGIFQPHRYSRTMHLAKEFGGCFGNLDLLLLAPVYAASEAPIEGVSSGLIAENIRATGQKNFELISGIDIVPQRLASTLRAGDVVVTIGAGDVWKSGDALLAKLKKDRLTKMTAKSTFEADLSVREFMPLAPETSFRIGGPAQFFIEPKNFEELTGAIARCVRNGIPIKILGGGSNVLISDRGIEGAVIRLAKMNTVTRDGNRVISEAGAQLAGLVRRAEQWGLSGLERLAGIPGSVGGAVTMNAGGKFGCISSVIKSVTILDMTNGSITELSKDQIGLGYRESGLNGRIVLRAEFELCEQNHEWIVERHIQVLEDKAKSQPLNSWSAGCIFKNPDNDGAGRLIDSAGMKGRRVGHALVSPVHANFIVNEGGASADDVKKLITEVHDTVNDKFGVNLELEILMWN